MGLSSIFASNLRTKLAGPDDDGWRVFILDHLDYIANRSKTFELDDKLMNLYRFDLERFLKNFLSRHENITWIVLLLNSLPNDLAFVDIKYLIVPDDSLIINLYHSYISIKANANK